MSKKITMKMLLILCVCFFGLAKPIVIAQQTTKSVSPTPADASPTPAAKDKSTPRSTSSPASGGSASPSASAPSDEVTPSAIVVPSVSPAKGEENREALPKMSSHKFKSQARKLNPPLVVPMSPSPSPSASSSPGKAAATVSTPKPTPTPIPD